MRIALTASLLLVPCLTAWGQLEVETEQVQRLTGTTEVLAIGDIIVFAAEDKVVTQPAVLVQVTTEADNVELDVEDKERNRIPFELISDEPPLRVYMISDPGKHWVEITALDFEKNIYRKNHQIITVPKATPVNPEPLPDPIPDPSSELQRLVQPIVVTLQNDREKAANVAVTYQGFAKAIRQVAPKDIVTFGQINDAALKTLNLGRGVMIGADIVNALSSHVPFELDNNRFAKNRPLNSADRERIAEVYEAVSWAARQ